MKGLAGLLGAFGLVLLLLAAAPAAALGPAFVPPGPDVLTDPTPGAPNAVHAAYAIDLLPGLEGFEIGVRLDVHELELPPVGALTAQQIRSAPDPLRSLFETAVHDAILAEAQRALPEAAVRLTRLHFDYRSEDLSADPYDPAVHIDAVVRADFTSQFFGLPATAKTLPPDLARAFLWSGGVYALNKAARVPAGYDVTYVVQAPDFLQLRRPDTAPATRLEYHRNNFQGSGSASLLLDFSVRLRPDLVPANVRAGPLVRAQFLVDDVTPLWKQAIPFVNGEYVGRLDLDIQVHSLNGSLFANYPLPRQVGLSQVSGDVLRIAINENLVARRDVEFFFERLIRKSLEEGFGPDIDLSFDWSSFTESLAVPVGGPDGATVAPVLVRARAELPFESNKMLVSSSLGRLFGMTVGTSGSFRLANDGSWRSEYTVAYPESVHVRVHDSAGLVQDMDWSTREGFHATLPQGASTEVYVAGRSDFEPVVFAIGLVEFALLLALGAWGWRKVRAARVLRARRPST